MVLGEALESSVSNGLLKEGREGARHSKTMENLDSFKEILDELS